MIVKSRNDKLEYVLESEKDNKDKTTWIFKSLSKRQLVNFGVRLQKMAREEEEVSQELIDHMYTELTEMVIGWKNLKNEEGEAIAFDKKALVDLLDNLDFDIVSELFGAITALNSLSGEESKNSD